MHDYVYGEIRLRFKYFPASFLNYLEVFDYKRFVEMVFISDIRAEGEESGTVLMVITMAVTTRVTLRETGEIGAFTQSEDARVRAIVQRAISGRRESYGSVMILARLSRLQSHDQNSARSSHA